MTNDLTRRRFLFRAAAWLTALVVGGETKIAWPARGPEKGKIRLAFYTDVHARTEWDTPKALKMAATAINAQNVDFVIAGGDLITDGFMSPAAVVAPRWDTYMQMHHSIATDLYPAIGNHDLVAAKPEDGSSPAADPRAIFLQRTGLKRTFYSFDAVGVHFIVLDSIQMTDDALHYQGAIGPEQIEWLGQDLAKVTKNTPIVLVTHIPLLTAFYFASRGATIAAPKNRVVVNNIEVLNLIEDHNVVLVLQGHLHVKEMIRWKGATYIVGGAVCGKWWRGSWFDTSEGFNLITISGNRIEWEYIDYGWQARRPPNH